MRSSDEHDVSWSGSLIAAIIQEAYFVLLIIFVLISGTMVIGLLLPVIRSIWWSSRQRLVAGSYAIKIGRKWIDTSFYGSTVASTMAAVAPNRLRLTVVFV